MTIFEHIHVVWSEANNDIHWKKIVDEQQTNLQQRVFQHFLVSLLS